MFCLYFILIYLRLFYLADSKYPYGHGWIIEKIDDNSNQSCRFKHLYYHSIDIDEQQHLPILSKIELNKQSQYFIIERSKHPRYRT